MNLKEFFKPTLKKIGITIILSLILLTPLFILNTYPSAYYFVQGSKSMYPTLDVGEIIFVKKEEKYNPGDIVVFYGWNKNPIAHRIVAISDGESVIKYENWNELSDKKILNLASRGEEKIYITKGDNNPICDQCVLREPVRESSIVGKMIFSIPYIGWLDILKIGFIVRIFVFYIIACTIIQFTRKKNPKNKNI